MNDLTFTIPTLPKEFERIADKAKNKPELLKEVNQKWTALLKFQRRMV